MKQYNCPDCQRTDSCDGCQRLLLGNLNSYYIYPKNTFENDPCSHCGNNAANGGSGICHCILGQQVMF
jgi:hypothetical protein